jgi:hypothetical protein
MITHGCGDVQFQIRILPLLAKTPKFDFGPPLGTLEDRPISMNTFKLLKRQKTLEALLDDVLTLKVRGFPANLP